MPVLLLRYLPYLVAGVLLAGAGAELARTFDAKRYAALQLDYANYRTQVSDRNRKAQAVAREALQAQIDDRARTDIHNAQVIHDLEASNAAIAADRDHRADLVRRLLAAGQARPGAAAGGLLPEAGRGSGLDAGTDTGGAGRLGELLGNAAAECRANAAAFQALVDQLRPQL